MNLYTKQKQRFRKKKKLWLPKRERKVGRDKLGIWN